MVSRADHFEGLSMLPVAIDGRSLGLDDVVQVARHRRGVVLTADARAKMAWSRAWVDSVGRGSQPVYGVNTGFGSLAQVRIDPAHRSLLSENLVRSHAAGVGAYLSRDVVRAMMLLRANALARGVSGCQPELVEALVALLEHDIIPAVPEQGSCGSSGDLAPLSHVALVLMEGGEGTVMVDGAAVAAGPVLAGRGVKRVRLGAKDGLALTNGAQLTTAIAALAVADCSNLVLVAELTAAMSIEALFGRTRAFHPAVHRERPYPGAIATAASLLSLMEGSSLCDAQPAKVQDAYSLRCTPQVIGAARDTLVHVLGQVGVELNAATDNPLILVDEEGDDKAYSAGLFHGEPVGIACDVLKIAAAEVASLSERRLYRLTTGHLSQRLPPALARDDRPDLGMLLPQTTAAALVSENKALGWPASMDSIPTCEDQEDHVAMSTTAARRAARVVQNSRIVVAIEALGAGHALRARLSASPKPTLGRGTARAYSMIESWLGSLDPRRAPSDDIARITTSFDELAAVALEAGAVHPLGARA